MVVQNFASPAVLRNRLLTRAALPIAEVPEIQHEPRMKGSFIRYRSNYRRRRGGNAAEKVAGIPYRFLRAPYRYLTGPEHAF